MAQANARRLGVDIFDESKPMWRILLVFLVPLMISNILQSASSTFASIFLGRLLGVNALAAVSAVFPVVFLLFSFLLGIASGSTVLIGQAYGAGDIHRVKKIAGTVLGATMIFAVIVAIAGTLLSPLMLKALGTPAVVIGASDAYTKIVFLTAPVLFPYLVYTTFLRGTGDSKTPLRFLIVSTVLSIVLTPAFILGWLGTPHLGVISAALSGLISQGVAFIGLLILLARRNHPLKFDGEMARDMAVDWRILWQVVRIGVATGIQIVTVSLAELAIISFVNHYGARATAAYGAVNQIVSYVQFPAISIGIAASIFGAQCIGAKRADKMGSVVRSAVALNYAIGGVLIVACYSLAYPLLELFVTDQKTVEIAHQLLMITLWSYLVYGNLAVIGGIMRSSGVVFWPTLNAILGIIFVEVTGSWVCMHLFGLPGVWMGYPLYYCVILAVNFGYYELFWKKRVHERLV
jgi:putative MATE family efflux protein